MGHDHAFGVHTHGHMQSLALAERWPVRTDPASPPAELCFVCVLISIHRNFHHRWSRCSNPPSGPEHLEGVKCETQLRFIYHPNPRRLLTLPAGSTLTALVVRCEKSRLTPIKQQSCRTDSSTHFLLVDLWAGKHVRKEHYHWLAALFFCGCCLCCRREQDFFYHSVCAPDTEKAVINIFFKICLTDFKLDLVAGSRFTEKVERRLFSQTNWINWLKWGWIKDWWRFSEGPKTLRPRGSFTVSPAGSLHWILFTRPGAAPVQPALLDHVSRGSADGYLKCV